MSIDFKKMILARPEGYIRGGVFNLRRDIRNNDFSMTPIPEFSWWTEGSMIRNHPG
jgi:hypothetical protein